MSIKLICTQPFGIYAKGQLITASDEIAMLLKDRDHHFVKIDTPDPAPVNTEVAADAAADAILSGDAV